MPTPVPQQRKNKDVIALHFLNLIIYVFMLGRNGVNFIETWWTQFLEINE